MSDLQLFDVDRTTERECLLCGSRRSPDDERAQECEIDRRRADGDRDAFGPRPAACLNTIDPRFTEIPY
jgi:hypothetical protein